jgi:hypothetical protein
MNTSNDAMSDDETNTSVQELDQLPDNQAAELLAEFERRRRVSVFLRYHLKDQNCFKFFSNLKARQMHVPTDDTEVKMNLRQLNEPICKYNNHLNF